MRNFYIQYDANKFPSGFYPQSDTIYHIILVANAMKSVLVPEGATLVEFKATNNFYSKFDANVTIPVADVTNGTAGELNPDKRIIKGVTTINLIAAASTKVTLSFYNVPGPAWG